MGIPNLRLDTTCGRIIGYHGQRPVWTCSSIVRNLEGNRYKNYQTGSVLEVITRTPLSFTPTSNLCTMVWFSFQATLCWWQGSLGPYR